MVFVIVLGVYIQHALSYLATRSQAVHQKAIVSQLARANRALRQQQQDLNDPAVIRRDARALGMVMPGERSWVVSGLP